MSNEKELNISEIRGVTDMAGVPPARAGKMSEQLKGILGKRFKTAPSEIRSHFPEVISGEHLKYFTFFCDKYTLLVFVDDEDKTRIEEMLEQKREPFPGLITYNPDSQFLFKLDGEKNLSLQGCTVSGAFTFYYGEDSTITLKDHHQTISIVDWGELSSIL